ncbi:MAG TPA: hypothetical protein VF108_08150 [Actinomycetota bacterium]
MSSGSGLMRSSGRRGLWRRFERLLLGVAMGIVAFVIERRVLRSIKRTGASPWPAPDATTLEPTSRDGVVNVELDRGQATGDR